MLGWLFSGSLVIASAEALLLFSGSDPGDLRPLRFFAALGKILSSLPGVLLLIVQMGILLPARGPWLLASWRPIIVVVLLIDLLCILFLLLLKEGKRSLPGGEFPEIATTTLEEE